MSSALSSLASSAYDRKEWIAVAAGVAFAVSKLTQLAASKHLADTHQRRAAAAADNAEAKLSGSAAAASAASSSSSALTLDPSIFPHYLRSASVPSLYLFTRKWEVIHPRFVVFLLHGYGEHCGRYESLASRLCAAGGSVYALDHQGHGQSDGDRAYVERFRDYVTDALTFIEATQSKLGAKKPAFLLGHSMGGLLAAEVMRASYAVDRSGVTASRSEEGWANRLWPWSGCVLSSPALAANPSTATPLLIRIGTLFSDWLPKIQLTALPIDGVSRIPSVVEHYRMDTLVWKGTMRARWGSEMLHTMASVAADHRNVHWPVLIIQGDADTIVHAPGATTFHTEVSSKDKTLRVWKGGFHELFNDTVSEQAMREVTDWMLARCGGK